MRFIVIGGKGGVGRTTVSAALATVLARQGKRVLLAHVRTQLRMDRLLGCGVIDETIRHVEPNLWAVNMNPRAALRERGMMVLKLESVYRAVMENRLVKHFLKAVPSLDEYSMLGKAWFHTTEMREGKPRFDTVVFDGQATGHLITMLRIPRVILESVPEGPLTRDALEIQEMLTDPRRTNIWIVTLAEEMPASESLDLYDAAVDDLKITPSRLIINGLYTDEFERAPHIATALDQLAGMEDLDPAMSPMVDSAVTLRARRAINRRYLDILRDKIPLPVTELPHLFVPQLDRDSLNVLAARIEESLSKE